jgi:alkanesulfonate monooxygenase SsuD/methylene tetrahydromethanopterin reductase-like flavin-dependent oxidoreductase (luciferase family)
VRLSAFTVVDAYPPDADLGENRLGDVVRLAEVAESAGLSALWVAEHHFHAGGVCPSPPVLLAACGARTQRLRLGSLVSVLPFHRPIDLAEEYAMVDRLLQGRLNLGVGSGYIPMEFEGFGVDPATKRETFDRALGTLLEALEGREVRPDGSNGVPVRINVLPVQRPHPPVWIAVQRREAIPFVARRGVSLALIPYATVADRRELGAEIEEYRRHLPKGTSGEVAVAVHLYAGDRTDLARRAFREYLESRLRTQSAFYRQKVEREPHRASPEALEESGFALFGAPETVAGHLAEFAQLGVDELLGIFDFGGLPPHEVHGSVRALGAAWSRNPLASPPLRPDKVTS